MRKTTKIDNRLQAAFHLRSSVQRRSPLEVRGLPELRPTPPSERARPRLPSIRPRPRSTRPRPHLVGFNIVRRRPHNPRRQHLEPPRRSATFRLGHLVSSSHASCDSMVKAHAVASEPTGQRFLASRYRCAASTTCPELQSAAVATENV